MYFGIFCLTEGTCSPSHSSPRQQKSCEAHCWVSTWAVPSPISTCASAALRFAPTKRLLTITEPQMPLLPHNCPSTYWAWQPLLSNTTTLTVMGNNWAPQTASLAWLCVLKWSWCSQGYALCPFMQLYVQGMTLQEWIAKACCVLNFLNLWTEVIDPWTYSGVHVVTTPHSCRMLYTLGCCHLAELQLWEALHLNS